MQYGDRYHLYGLASGNPYVNRPLDPLTCDADADLLHDLTGFIQPAAIGDALEKAVRAEGPAFFLITGVGNSGRTSLANHIMYRYRRIVATHLSRHHLVTHVAERADMTYDSYAILRSTLLSLRNKMRHHHVAIPPDLRDLFDELRRRPRADPLDDYDLQEIAEFIAVALAAADMGFGVRYEGVPTKDLINQAVKVFENTSTVVVFTLDRYKHAGAAQLADADRQEFARKGHVIDLSALNSHQIAALSHLRWTGHPPSPFDTQGIRNAFSARSCTIGQALRHLEVLLRIRLSEYDKDDPWPNDDLHIPENWIRLKLWQADQWNGRRGSDD